MHKSKKTPGRAGAPWADFETWARATPGLPFIALLPCTVVEILRIALAALVLLSTATTTQAQWDIEESHTTASLRGIHNVGGGVAWASGTNGTVLRTEDGGYLWQTCAIPGAGTKDTAEKLDFRGIQAFDENTAIVMSSGPGDQSRLYKTTDGCQTWKLLFTNPDKDGFWDAIQLVPNNDPMAHGKCFGAVLGDPVSGHFTLFVSLDCGATWERQKTLPVALPAEGAFAASNSSLLASGSGIDARNFVTGGRGGARYLSFSTYVDSYAPEGQHPTNPPPYEINEWRGEKLPGSDLDDAAGAFAIGRSKAGYIGRIIVGGNYKKPDQKFGTAWYFGQDRQTERYSWTPAQTPPHGYRSAVTYDADTKTWITVGPNGTDISTDDGRNWRPLTPTPQDTPDADKNWNALSLPFVVGPKGRIGKLRPDALTSHSKNQVKDKK